MRLNLLACALAAAAISCSSGASPAGSTSSASTDDSGVIGCNSDPRAQTYKAGLSQMGTSKNFKFELVSSNPAPATTGTEVWMLKILDAGGQPVTDATFPSTPSSPNPRPWMPEHGHGTSLVGVTNNHDGTYTFNPMYLYMVGLWETDIVVNAGGKTDSTKFFFCLQ